MNRKSVLVVLVLIMLMQVVSGQEYLVHGTTPDIYLQHKVQPSETWYAISRKYNLPPEEIAAFNGVTIDRKLDIGQQVKVPLRSTNFTQGDINPRDGGLVPVYHVVQEREWMYRISVNHNKVPIERLEKWNAISRDNAKAGTKLIVGFLKLKDGQHAQTPKVSTNNDAPAPNTAQAGSSGRTGSVVTKPPVVQEPAGSAVKSGSKTGNTSTLSGGGYFSSQYEGGNSTVSGVAGVFRSTSGWEDGKYYALLSNITVGTIIKITYPQTNKIIYAKVLGELPDMKESAGLKLRISDAAAKELGATSSKFSVDITH